MTRKEKLNEIKIALDAAVKQIERDELFQGYTSDYNIGRREALELVYELTAKKLTPVNVALSLKKAYDTNRYCGQRRAYVDVIVWCDEHLWGGWIMQGSKS